jgi:phage/plasmid primase-like uncharacterized protein
MNKFIKNSKDYNNNIKSLKENCKGIWPQIISSLAPDLDDAIKYRPHHVPCPIHGGKDGLRAFNDFDGTGGMICNTCGSFPDGIATIMWINDWSFPTTIKQIQSYLDNKE